MSRSIEELETIARRIRLLIVQMIGVGKKGHLGGSCSIADIVTALYFSRMKHDPKNPAWDGRDRFLLSKGHAALAQYAALAETGYFPMEELDRLKVLGSILQGHPEINSTPGVEANTGSLGQGLSMACGMAAGLKRDGKPNRVYCIVGDGELAEGQIWEAALTGAFYKLDNLTVFLDKNGIQATGPVVERYDTNPLPEKWKAFGWFVREIDGHDMKEICAALDEANTVQRRPQMIIARTVKGKGVCFAENKAAFHHGEMNQGQYDQACGELK